MRTTALGLLALVTAFLLLDRVTMLTVPVDGAQGMFGFPFPAFGPWSASSLWVEVFWQPLLLDWAFYTVVVLPGLVLATRRLHRGVVVGLALAVTVFAMVDVGVRTLGLGIIRHRHAWTDPHPDWPVQERCLYIGIPNPGLPRRTCRYP